VTWGGVFAHVGDDLLRAKAAEVEGALRAKPRPTKLDQEAARGRPPRPQQLPSRLFVAVQVPEAVGAGLARAVARTEGVAPSARWASPRTFHVTLAFLGDVSAARLPEVLGALVEVSLRHAPPDLVCAGAGTFGSTRRPAVLWAGVGGDVSGLQALHRDLHAALAPLGVETPLHPFAPHVTLAKAAHAEQGDLALARAATSLRDADFGGFRADRMLVCRSEEQGLKVIATLPLRGLATCSNPDCEGGSIVKDYCAACEGPVWETCPTCKGGSAPDERSRAGMVVEGNASRAATQDDDAVRDGLRKLASREPPGALLSVRSLRSLLPSLDKPRFDGALLRLSQEGEIVLHHHDFPSSLSPAERDELVRDEQGVHYVGVAFHPHGRRAGPDRASFPQRFDAAFAKLDGASGGHNYVTLEALRRALPDISRADFDAGLHALRKARHYTLDPSDGRHVRLTDAERDAGIREGSHLLVYVARHTDITR
jgi:2'-5' RNA ligase